MTRAGIYSRQSKGNDRSIEQQETELLADVTNLGWSVGGTYSDGSSASRFATKGRDDWESLLADIEAGLLDAVCLWESSRGDRTLTSWSAFLDLCRKTKTLIRITNHETTYNMANHRHWKTLADEGVNNAYASEETSERIRRDVRNNAAKGRPGGKLLYGYARRYEVVNGKPRVVEQYAHPQQGAVVIEAVERVAKLEPLEKIAKDFNERGIPAPKGGKWSGTQIRRLCLNREYLGLRVHDGTEYPAIWPALYDEATWKACHNVLSNPDRKSYVDGSAKHLLTNIAYAACGGTLRVQQSRGKLYYQCAKDFCVSIPLAELDQYVNEEMPELMFDLEATETGPTTDSKAIEAEIRELEAYLRDFAKDAVRLRLSASRVLDVENEANQQLDQLRQKLRNPSVPKVVYEYVQKPSLWLSQSLEAKRVLVRALVAITVLPVGNRYGHFSPEAKPQARDRVRIEQIGTLGYLVPRA